MEKSTELKQWKAKPLQQVRVIRFNRVIGSIYTVFTLKMCHLRPLELE